MENQLDKKRVLIVSPVECYPPFFGNSSRIASILEFLLEDGYEVNYLHFPERPFDPEAMKEHLGKNYHYRPYKRSIWVSIKLGFRAIQTILLRKNSRVIKVDDLFQPADIALYQQTIKQFHPSIVLVNYTYLSKLFQYTPPGIRKILDTHDSLHLRFKQLYQGAKANSKISIGIKDEIQAINRADQVISIQQAEATFFKKNGCQKKMYTIGHFIPFKPTETRGKRYKLLYIGANYETNIAGIRSFIDQIWLPEVENQEPWELYIAGGISQALTGYADHPSIRLLGFVDDLFPLYNSIDVAINPVNRGSGLKIKNIEALSYGKPVLTTPVGAEGLESFEGKGLCLIKDKKAWLGMLKKMLENDHYYQEVVKAIPKTLTQYNTLNKQQLQTLLNE